MRNSIIVNVTELRSMLQDIRRSGCDCVSLTIDEADCADGDVFPTSISFSACKGYEPDKWIDFEPIDAVPNESELSEKSLTAFHISSNLL